MPEQLLTATRKSALERIEAAETLDQLEAVRVEVASRNGTLAAVSKDFKKLSPEDRARIGK
ncbi:MAG TPA: phenylalanine--tRNA ligase subunit alpha, partial [Bryobacteraceae bacterium]